MTMISAFFKPRRLLLITVLALFSFSSFSFAQAPVLVQTNATIMLNAVRDGIYASFVASASDEFKASYLQEYFDVVVEDNASRLGQGYEATYLSSLNIEGYVVYLWKLTFQDGGDDSLLSLSVQNGFVVGFLLQ